MNLRKKVVRWNDAIDPKKTVSESIINLTPAHTHNIKTPHTRHTHAYRDTGVDEIVDKASKAFTAELLPEKLGMCAFFPSPFI